MITHLATFLPDLADKTQSLRSLTYAGQLDKPGIWTLHRKKPYKISKTNSRLLQYWYSTAQIDTMLFRRNPHPTSQVASSRKHSLRVYTTQFKSNRCAT